MLACKLASAALGACGGLVFTALHVSHACLQALLSGHMEALWSQYRPLTRPDHKLLARLLQPKPGDIKSKVRGCKPEVRECEPKEHRACSETR